MTAANRQVNFLLLFLLLLLLLLLLAVPLCYGAIVLHEMELGVVGAGNYSYYLVTDKGTVIILLHTYQGDADLYVSVGKSNPTFELDHHNFQSVTCGLDRVDVPLDASRPAVIIGVYGHPSHEISTYGLQVIVDDSPEDYPDLKENSDIVSSSASKQMMPHVPSVKNSPSSEDEQSLIWTLFVSILKVLLEVIAS